jgi:cyclic pyranopterin phosphate synthase
MTSQSDDDQNDHGLTHIDAQGQARMVDVTSKPITRRVAVAKCVVITKADALLVLRERPDGLSVIEAARFAGIQGAKQTSSLIPLCHSIRLDRVEVDVIVASHRIEVSATTEIVERTGVEMEALTACALASATLFKALLTADPEVSIEELTLWHKSGGRSGDWHRDTPADRLTRRPAVATAEAPSPESR